MCVRLSWLKSKKDEDTKRRREKDQINCIREIFKRRYVH